MNGVWYICSLAVSSATLVGHRTVVSIWSSVQIKVTPHLGLCNFDKQCLESITVLLAGVTSPKAGVACEASQGN